MSAKWNSEQMPDQQGRTAIVTGANSGLGLATARELARHGASVVLACRNIEKGEAALKEIESAAPGARLECSELDLGSLSSVQSFAERFRSAHDGLDLLINNAGLMAPPRQQPARRAERRDGRAALPVCRDPPGSRGRQLRGAGRDRRVPRTPARRLAQQRRPGHGGRGAPVDGLRGAHRRALRPGSRRPGLSAASRVPTACDGMVLPQWWYAVR